MTNSQAMVIDVLRQSIGLLRQLKMKEMLWQHRASKQNQT